MDIIRSFKLKMALCEGPDVTRKSLMFSQVLQDFQQNTKDPISLPRAAWRLLVFDLSYLFQRYPNFLKSPFFFELSVSFFQTEYGFPFSMAEDLMSAFLHRWFQEADGEPIIMDPSLDQTLMEQLLITALQADKDENLALELGFGTELMQLIKASFELFETPSESLAPSAFVFAPKRTADMLNALRGIVPQWQNCPWSLDLLRLHSLLWPRQPAANPHDKNLDLPVAMALITSCARQPQTQAQLESRFSADRVAALLPLILEAKLLFAWVGPKHKRPSYELSELGFAMTQVFFSYQYWQQNPHTIQLRKVPGPYHKALLRLVYERDPNLWEETIHRDAMHMSPLACEENFLTYQNHKELESVLEFFKNLLHNRPHAWVRAAVCRVIPIDEGHEDVEALFGLLLNDDSMSIRETARHRILQRTQATDTMF